MTNVVLRFFSVFLGAAVCSCTVSERKTVPGDDDAASASLDSAPEITSTSATYFVPVEPAREAAASFPVGNVKWRVTSDRARLDYKLPAELAGSEQRVLLEGSFDATKNAYVLSGVVGTGECTLAANRLRCVEHLPGVVVDVEAAMALAPPNVDAAKRRSVVEQFPTEPVGILEANLSTRGRPHDGTENEIEDR